MNTRKIVIRAVLVLIGMPIVLVLLAFGFFYSVFYFPNWTSATTGTIVSSGEKREYLLCVPKNYHRTQPTPLVISLHTSMSWPSSSMAISQWNLVADDRRAVWSAGRDLMMQLPQDDGPVNSFPKMYVEVNGKQSTDWTREFTYKSLTPDTDRQK
jgi:hypothetical protein